MHVSTLTLINGKNVNTIHLHWTVAEKMDNQEFPWGKVALKIGKGYYFYKCLDIFSSFYWPKTIETLTRFTLLKKNTTQTDILDLWRLNKTV